VEETKSLSSSRVMRFGVFQANLAARELRKHGVRVRLPGQPFYLLSMLIEKPGEIVTREEMRQRLWPSDTFVDFEHSLNSAIKKLRAALGDSPENSRYVETIPRVGYRFIAPVEAIYASTPAVAPPLVSERETLATQWHGPTAKSQARTRLLFAACGAALVVLTLVATTTFVRPPVPRVTRISRITDSGKVEPWADPVTDGSRIYFLEREGGHWNLVQSSTTGGAAQPVASSLSGNTRVLDVSPDMSQLLAGTFLIRDSEMAIWTMPVQGGAPRRLGEIMARHAIWAPDGKHILYTRESDLNLCDADGQNSRMLASVPGRILGPSWSPDGRALRFTVSKEDTGSASLWEVGADGKNLHALFPGENKDYFGRWTPDGKYFIFVSSRDGKPNLWAIRVNRGLLSWKMPRPVKLTSGPNEFVGLPMPSRDGKRIFAYQTNPQNEVARLDPKLGTLTVVPGNEHRSPNWCPRGEWVVYADTEYAIWRARSDGSQLLQLTHPPFIALGPQWSPDSMQILFTGVSPGGLAQIYVISRDGGEPKMVLPSDTDMHESKAKWHPNGKEIIFAGGRRDRANVVGGGALFVAEVSTGRSYKLSGSEGLEQGVYAPDGQHILGVTGDYHTLLIFDVRTQKWTALATGTLLSSPTWTSDSRSFYYQDLLGENEPIYRFWLKTGKREQIFDFREQLKSGYFRAGLYAPGPKGSLLVVLSRGYADLYALDVDFP